jgi:hypothetical protein
MLAMIAICGCGKSFTTEEVLKIGMTIPLSGFMADAGRAET